MEAFLSRFPLFVAGLILLFVLALAFEGWLLPAAITLVIGGYLLRHRPKAFVRWCLFGSFAAVFALVSTSTRLSPEIAGIGTQGTGLFVPHSVKKRGHGFRLHYLFDGTLHNFKDEEGNVIATNVRCFVRWKPYKPFTRPPANQSYQLTGRLGQMGKAKFFLDVPKRCKWLSQKPLRNLAEVRFQLQQSFRSYLKSIYQTPRTAEFLSGLATGNFDDPLIREEFSRFGLQHVMAVSGFHFGIVATVIGGALRIFLSLRTSVVLLIAFLVGYLFFLGVNVAVLRAFTMSALMWVGLLAGRRNTSMNALGAAMVVCLLIDPTNIYSMAFQMSFTATFCLIGGCAPVERWLEQLLPTRNMETLSRFDLADQHAYIILAALKKPLGICIAVHLGMLPLCGLYFQTFPLLSLVFNLFYPFLVSISLILLLLGVGLQPLPFISGMIHRLNERYTTWCLDVVFDMPTGLDVMIPLGWVSAPLVVGYLACLVYVSFCRSESTLPTFGDATLRSPHHLAVFR